VGKLWIGMLVLGLKYLHLDMLHWFQDFFGGFSGFITAVLSGWLAKIGVDRLKQRSVIIEKSVNIQRIAFATNHAEVGEIKVLFNDIPCLNLYSVRVEVKNNSWKGLKDFPILVSVLDEFVILRDTAVYYQGDVSISQPYSDPFLSRRNFVNKYVNNSKKPAEYDSHLKYTSTHKEYQVRILNRKSSLVVDFLVEGPQNMDTVNVGIYEDNIDVVWSKDAAEELKRRNIAINLIYLLIYFISCYFIAQYSLTPQQAVWYTIASLFASYFSALLIYLIGKYVKYLFTK
jgi:hypothetical protein